MPPRVHDSLQLNETSEEQKDGAKVSEAVEPRQEEIKKSENSMKAGEGIKADKQIDSMSDLKELKEMILKLQAEVKVKDEEVKAQKEENKAQKEEI